MLTLVAVLHILFCLGLISFVLLQDPKGGGASGVFGGAGANQLFGTTGAANLLTKITSYCAILFGVTCILMSILPKPNMGSVVDQVPTTKSEAPKTDGAAAAGGAAAPAAPVAPAPAPEKK